MKLDGTFDHYLFAPRVPIATLTLAQRKTVVYTSTHLSRLRWGDGELPYRMLQQLLNRVKPGTQIIWLKVLFPNLSKHARKYFQKIFEFFFLLKSKNQFSKNCFRFLFFEKNFWEFFLKIFENYFEIFFFDFFVDNFFDGIFDKILDEIFEKNFRWIFFSGT